MFNKKIPLFLLSSFSLISFCGVNKNFSKSINDYFYVDRAADKEKDNQPEELTITMVPLGYDGDCFIITIGNTQILVDAGGFGDKESGDRVYDALNECFDENSDDKILDFCIFTHSDQDHIFNFAGTKDGKSVSKFVSDKGIKIENFIDFDVTSDATNFNLTTKLPVSNAFKNGCGYDSGNETYNSYKNKRDEFIKTKKIVNYYSSSQLFGKKRLNDDKLSSFYKEAELNKEDAFKKKLFSAPNLSGVKDQNTFFEKGNIFKIDKNTELKILYNVFYSRNYDVNATICPFDINVRSVCFMINHKHNGNIDKFLFCGDLEEYDSGKKIKDSENNDSENNKPHANYFRKYGESYFVKDNYNDLKDGVLFYKASHHGSDTSNSPYLLNVIKPEYVAIQACSAERYDKDGTKDDSNKKVHDFPGQFALNNITKWTDRVYISELRKYDSEEKKWFTEDYFGKTIFKYSKEEKYSVDQINSGYKKDNGILSVEYSGDYGSQSIFENEWFYNNRQFNAYITNLTSPKLQNTDVSADCTYIKYGHIDILINAGVSQNTTAVPYFSNSIKSLCNDGILDYLIVTDFLDSSCSDLYQECKNKTYGLLVDPNISILNAIIPTYSKSFEEDHLHKKVINKLNSNGFTNLVTNGICDSSISLSNDNSIIDTKIIFLADARYSNNTFNSDKLVSIVSLFNIDVKGTEQRPVSTYLSYLHLGSNTNIDELKDNVAKMNEDLFKFNSAGGSYSSSNSLNVSGKKRNHSKLILQIPKNGTNAGTDGEFTFDILRSIFGSYPSSISDAIFVNARCDFENNKPAKYYRSNSFGNLLFPTSSVPIKDKNGKDVIINNYNLSAQIACGYHQYSNTDSSYDGRRCLKFTLVNQLIESSLSLDSYLNLETEKENLIGSISYFYKNSLNCKGVSYKTLSESSS